MASVQTNDAAPSPLVARARDTWAQMRAYAQSPMPAYSLAALCAVAMPFGLGHVASAAKVPRLVPPYWQLLGFGGFFSGGGYIISQGDVLNGSGVVTAWSLTYLTFKTLPTLPWLYRSPLSLCLSLAVGSIGLGVSLPIEA
ncbi:hypothetical protein MVES1_002488 [Malassezia vespertilionis]|uniref:uncharacterized protein n=1 Tax=Malassezia vespertilionis TaxID=2020962 RepID=UPI0024B27EA2|nr:uncharacterized protein MVES1_002488 [Malassezia vespertilionis]WFD07131.1 hypothetical protein MVES1_002488 [Malassezia vespertilionis]